MIKNSKYLIVYILSVSIVFLITACDEGTIQPNIESELYFPPANQNTWEQMPPSDLGWCTNSLNDLQAFLSTTNSKAFIILKDGKIVVEWYFDGFGAQNNWYWASAGKTMTAFLVGIAQDQALLNINDATSDYLGQGWTNLTSEQENQITIQNQLSMTTGLNYEVENLNCINPECLTFRATPGSQWYYHNAPYTLLTNVIENASNQNINMFAQINILSKIGMSGSYLNLGSTRVFTSNARSMARFGLLALNRGKWANEDILMDKGYFDQMTNTSQSMNPAYGYLWWLNGKSRLMLPGSSSAVTRTLVPTAPLDMIAGLGANDQCLFVVPSENMVVVRLGDDSGIPRDFSGSFENDLWQKIAALRCN
ncbi:serine hydrolase domain-containing protein [Peijinzhouia sedimentorum]|tara:strand:- start:332 stop:1429 length:1098 start_codon:yes stop_codon:yes gene_type:complete